MLVVISLSTVSSAFSLERGQRERAFVRALELFDSAKSADDYRESARLFESILADGYRNGAVYYNSANAWYRAGEYGRAILNYRKAKPYRPRDPYLTANLEQALAAAPGSLPKPAGPWWSHVLFWTYWLTYPAKVRLAFWMSTLGAASLLAAQILKMARLKLVTVALVFVAVSLAIDVSLSSSDVTTSRRAVITGETIARKGTGTSYEAAFDQPLRDGAEFEILSEASDWTFGHFENIGDGWVRNEFVAR